MGFIRVHYKKYRGNSIRLLGNICNQYLYKFRMNQSLKFNACCWDRGWRESLGCEFN